jgi:phage shock protein PspC (stress-responsive transcriptional regulator)
MRDHRDMTETTAPHPTGGHGTAPRRLVRTSDGKIAGVAAGIAHYLGLDPAIVRIAFILLVFAGGIGLLLYIACWIAMPKGEAPPAADGASAFDPWLLGAVAALVVGLALLFGGASWGPGFQVTAGLALVVGGLWLLVRDRDGRDGGPATTAVPPAPTPPASTPAASSPAGAPGAAPSARRSDDEDASAPGSALALREGGAVDAIELDGAIDEHAIDDAEIAWAASHASPTAPGSEEPLPRAPAPVDGRRSGALTAGVLSLLAIGSALAIAGALAGWFDVSTSVVAAVALVIVGAGLVLAAVVGRAPWLFVVGGLLTVVLLAAAAVEPYVDDGIGDELVRPASAAELLPTYRFGIGEYTVDLRDVSLSGDTVRIAASLGIGQLTVVLPRETTTVVAADVDAGAIVLPSNRGSDDEIDGLRESARFVHPGTSGGRLLVDAHVGFGELVVSTESEVVAP